MSLSKPILISQSKVGFTRITVVLYFFIFQNHELYFHSNFNINLLLVDFKLSD